jgi:hypothetical protein
MTRDTLGKEKKLFAPRLPFSLFDPPTFKLIFFAYFCEGTIYQYIRTGSAAR